MDIAQGLVADLQLVQPVLDHLPLEIEDKMVAQGRSESQLDDLSIAFESAAGDVLLLRFQPPGQVATNRLPAGFRCELGCPGRAWERDGIVERPLGDGMLDRRLVLLGLLQISG